MSIYDQIGGAGAIGAAVAHLVETPAEFGVPGEMIGQIGAALGPLRVDIVTVSPIA